MFDNNPINIHNMCLNVYFLIKCIIIAFVWWFCLYVQNPNYMKENFSIVIESYHIADRGTQENVSDVVLKMY